MKKWSNKNYSFFLYVSIFIARISIQTPKAIFQVNCQLKAQVTRNTRPAVNPKLIAQANIITITFFIINSPLQRRSCNSSIRHHQPARSGCSSSYRNMCKRQSSADRFLRTNFQEYFRAAFRY